MNWNRTEGNWEQLKGNEVHQNWGKLISIHVNVVAGKREQLAGKIQEMYVIGRDITNRKIDECAPVCCMKRDHN